MVAFYAFNRGMSLRAEGLSVAVTALVFLLGFSAISIAFWAYFRRRDMRSGALSIRTER